jgi:hypothetical protein
MDRNTRADLVILAAALAGIAAVQGARTVTDRAPASDGAPMLALPTLVATASLTRRAGQATGWYPDRIALLGTGAFALGFGLGLVSHKVRALLPMVG